MSRNAPTTNQLQRGFMAIAMALLLTNGFAAQADDGDVLIKGNIIVYGAQLSNAMVIVELDNRECIFAPLSPNGHFSIRIPEGRNARMRFDMPGFTAKEILLDTQNAEEIRKYKKKRPVEFDVHLRPQLARGAQEYATPVGRIKFLKGGLMKVNYEYRLRPIDYNDLSVGE